MKTLPIVLATQFDNRDNTFSKDSKLVNGYLEMRGKKISASKRPGHDAGTFYSAGAGQGLVVYIGVLRVFVNNTFYTSPSTSFALTGANNEIIDFV